MSRLIYAAYFLAAGLACLVIGAVMLRVHVQLGRRVESERGWTRSLDELPDPFARPFGDR